MSGKTFLSQSVLFIKKSKKSERKHKHQYINSPDDQKYQNINNEQTPEYLSAISQFLERRSSQKINTDDIEESLNSPNTSSNKVKFAEKENKNEIDNDNHNSDADLAERRSTLSRKTYADDTEESTTTSSKVKLSLKTNDSRSENRNTSSSVNYEKFQTGKINDSIRKNVTLPSTSFEVSSDTNVEQKQDIPSAQMKQSRIINNLNNSRHEIKDQVAGKSSLEHKKSSMSKTETTNSNKSMLKISKHNRTASSDAVKIDSNSAFNIKRSKSERKKSSLLNIDSVDSTNATKLNIFELGSSERKSRSSLSKEANERINGFIKYTAEQSTNSSNISNELEENTPFKFTSYVPFIRFNDLKWHGTNQNADFGWYCEWRKPKWNNTSVLIRRIKSSTMRNANILISEINALSTIRHPNILVLMGFTFDSGKCLMPIYQYFRHSLYSHLHEMACALSLHKIINLMLQIIEALSFAHMMGIIHTTISSHCIALSDDFNNAKIFGFDFCVSTNSGIIPDNIGRKQWYQWLAPEFFDSHLPNAHVSLDVYSICVILWECCYLSLPWKNISYGQLSQVFNKWRMGIPLTNNRYLPIEIYNILKSGFQIDPNSRTISLIEITASLKQLQKQLRNGENLFLFTSVEQLSSEMGLQKVIIKKYIQPETNIDQQISSTTPSPKSISTNPSPQDKISSKETENEEEVNTLEAKQNKVLNKKIVEDIIALHETPKTSQKIVNPRLNSKKSSKLNEQIEQCTTAATVTNYDIKKLIYEYEILTKHIQDSNIPCVNLDRTKLYIRNTDIKPASHRSTFIKIPAPPGFTEHLIKKNKENIPLTKMSVQQQKRMCIDELKNFFEHYLWKKEKNKCVPITDATLVMTKMVEIDNEIIVKTVDTNDNIEIQKKIPEFKNKSSRCHDNNSEETECFIKNIITDIIDTVVCLLEEKPIVLYTQKLEKELSSKLCSNSMILCSLNHQHNGSIQTNGFKMKISSVKQCKMEQQKITFQIKRILDILNFYINLINIPPALPAPSNEDDILHTPSKIKECSITLSSLSTTTNDVGVEECLNAYQFLLFKVPEFMNYWRNLLNLYIKIQLQDVYIDDDFTSDAVQLTTTDLEEFYIFDENEST